MHMKRLVGPLLALFWLGSVLGAEPSPKPPAPAEIVTVPNFRLLDHRGQSHELYRHKDARLVVLLVAGNGCPIVRHGLTELKRLREEFGSQGVRFALLNANAHDTREETVAEAKEFAIDFPIQRDRRRRSSCWSARTGRSPNHSWPRRPRRTR
jgi:hypothetical protein